METHIFLDCLHLKFDWKTGFPWFYKIFTKRYVLKQKRLRFVEFHDFWWSRPAGIINGRQEMHGNIHIPWLFLMVLRGSGSLHFCDSRSRTARNLALDCGFLVLFAALRARGRPEINFDYLFKAKKCNTISTFRQNHFRTKQLLIWTGF